ncbi:MAG: acylphosphatase [Euryarchaeota archaeon]|nr:acylphosphatase [Euryarchaeota archaeon]
MADARVHVYISGRVQGVFFRDSARERALALGVRGWARNLPDGRVEGVFEGPRERVEELVAWCRQGPPHALVTGVDVGWEAYRGEFRSFEVRRGYI